MSKLRLYIFAIMPFIVILDVVSQEAGPKIRTDTGYNSLVKIELFNGGLHYNRQIYKHSSVCLIATFNWKYILDPDNYDFQISPEYRFHFSRKKPWPQGFYLGSYLFYKDFVVARDIDSNGSMVYSKDEVTTAGLGIKPGYQYAFSRSGRWIIDFGLGFGYNVYADINNITGIPILDKTTYKVNFSGNIAVGYTF